MTSAESTSSKFSVVCHLMRTVPSPRLETRVAACWVLPFTTQTFRLRSPARTAAGPRRPANFLLTFADALFLGLSFAARSARLVLTFLGPSLARLPPAAFVVLAAALTSLASRAPAPDGGGGPWASALSRSRLRRPDLDRLGRSPPSSNIGSTSRTWNASAPHAEGAGHSTRTYPPPSGRDRSRPAAADAAPILTQTCWPRAKAGRFARVGAGGGMDSILR